MVPLVGLRCVIVLFPDHTHLLFAIVLMGKLDDWLIYFNCIPDVMCLLVSLRGGGGGGGVLSFLLKMEAWDQHLPFSPKKYQEIQAPQKIFDILATQKDIPHSVP